jgi:hypothetical protein
MQLSMLLMADYATVDAGGKLNILGSFDSLSAQQFPVKHPLMHLVMRFQPELGEYGDTRKLRIVLVDEDGQELFQVSGDFQIPALQKGQVAPALPIIFGIRDLEFPRPGRYEFRIFVDKEQKDFITLSVSQIEQPQPKA